MPPIHFVVVVVFVNLKNAIRIPSFPKKKRENEFYFLTLKHSLIWCYTFIPILLNLFTFPGSVRLKGDYKVCLTEVGSGTIFT